MTTLLTNLKHLTSSEELHKTIKENENVIVVCGRMGPMCVPVYNACEQLKDDYPNVAFCDMAFDIPDAGDIRNLPECEGFMGIPFTVYYKNGKVVKATSSLQQLKQIKENIEQYF